MIFEELPTVPTSEELIDKAFSRAARAGKAKGGLEAQQSMLQTAANVLSDNLENVVTSWPDFETVDPFYRELATAVLAESTTVPFDDDDIDHLGALRRSLSRVGWAGRKTREIHIEYQPRLRKTDIDTASKHRKQAFARLADVVEQVDTHLRYLNAARNALRTVPDIDPERPTIVVAGYPNVGKSSFVNAVTNARGEIASYPFTTTSIGIGHLDREYIRYQLIDTPGLLDRPPAERNEIEAQAVSALEHVADCVLFVLDPSETCGYPVEDQLALRESIEAEFDAVPIVTVANKADLEMATGVEHTMSVETGEGVETAIDVAVEAIDFEPTMPYESS